MIYYNTTNLTGADFKHAVMVAQNEDEAIKLLFKDGKPYSPSQVYVKGVKAGRRWILTSVRRSITNLTKDKYLKETGCKIKGIYGRLEGVWIINDNQCKLF